MSLVLGIILAIIGLATASYVTVAEDEFSWAQGLALTATAAILELGAFWLIVLGV